MAQKKKPVKKTTKKKEKPVTSETEETTDAKKSERRIERELLGIIGFLVLLVIIFVVASAIFKSFNTFDYEGLTFTKERAGNLDVYHYYYYFVTDGGLLNRYNLYLRIDPRKNTVPVYGDGVISYTNDLATFVSIDDRGLNECRYSVLAIANLAGYLQDNGIPVESAKLAEDNAGENETVITCENRPHNPVITIQQGEETAITLENNCYEITVTNCQILDAIERFTVQSILDAGVGTIEEAPTS